MLKELHAIFKSQKQEVENGIGRRRDIGKGYTRKDWLNDTIDWAIWIMLMSKALKPILEALLVETGIDATRQVGLQPGLFDSSDPRIDQWASDAAERIGTDVNAETEKQLRATLSQGQQNGESDEELAARIAIVFGAALTYRSDRIAGTETSRAQGYADRIAWDQSGMVEAKQWYTIEDERTCPFCMGLNGTTISLEGDFYSMGDRVISGNRTMDINYSDVGEPPLHVSCRCSIVPVLMSAQEAMADLGM
jgi:SPP1 gp7 family putative phage head morphogenesis protein